MRTLCLFHINPVSFYEVLRMHSNIQCGNMNLPDIPRSTVNGINGKQQLRVLRRMLGKSRHALLIGEELQMPIGRNISITIVWQELHGMCYHCRAAARKPYIIKYNSKHQMDWCKARHQHRWTLEQKPVLWSDEPSLFGRLVGKSGFDRCQENITS